MTNYTLLCNGDSWTHGEVPAQQLSSVREKKLDWYDIVPNFGNPTQRVDQSSRYKFYDSQVWPKVLGNELGFKTWNCGRYGISNNRIFRTTINSISYLESLGEENILAVIGLTSILRYETWNVYKPNEWECVTIRPEDFLSKDSEGFEYRENLIYNTIINIINLQNFFKSKNIPYLIFSSFDNMDEDLKASNLFCDIDLNNIYNNDFRGHFRGYIENKFSTNWDEEPYFKTNHPTDISHIEWGKHLSDYIKEQVL
jgi:hypothetical protein